MNVDQPTVTWTAVATDLSVFCFIFQLCRANFFLSLFFSLSQPCCIARLCRRGECQHLYILLKLWHDKNKHKNVSLNSFVQFKLTVRRLYPKFCVWGFFSPLNSAQLCLRSKLRQSRLCLKWLLLLWLAARVSAEGTVTVTGLSAQAFKSTVSVIWFTRVCSLCSASPPLTSSPSLPVSSGAAVLCRRGQQEWDGRRGRHWSTEERTLWEGWREGTVHTQNIPSKEASGQLSPTTGEQNIHRIR